MSTGFVPGQRWWPSRSVAVAAACAAVIGAVPLGAAPAYASAYQVVCGGQQTTTYAPGLTNTPQQVTRAGQNTHGPCVATISPYLFSGSTSFTSTTSLSCLSLLTANTGVDVIAWSTGATSTFAYDRTVTLVEGQTVVTLAGEITDGLFEGGRAVETITSLALDLTACSTAQGLRSTQGVSELTITGV